VTATSLEIGRQRKVSVREERATAFFQQGMFRDTACGRRYLLAQDRSMVAAPPVFDSYD